MLHTGGRPAFAGGFTAERTLADFALRADGSRVALESLAGMPCTAVAGIARPEAFFAMLRARGLVLETTQALPDHHDFAGWPVPADPARPVLCTEKDAAKLWRHLPRALAVPLDFAPEPSFFAAIDRLLDARLSSP